MRKIALLTTAGIMSVLAVTAPAQATDFPATCPTASTVAMAPGATAGTVNPGQVAKYRLSVPSGSVAEVAMYGAGDIDLQICRPGTTSPYCYAHNSAGLPDVCADEGLEGPQGQGAGPGIPAGTWTIMVNHCTDTGCGYPADAPAPLPFTLAIAIV